ncbi:response regulator [Gemmatimonas sp.]|uniref:response regulator n=1 Tax=Gemmatimonas sp. TaxID=1962908 RepID=UPI00286DD157|nr:response regulator [Gemmatimonas sp.]
MAADSVRLRQIVINLLSNAVKFTAQGEVHLRVSTKGGHTPSPHSATHAPQCLLKFSITDTAIGIDVDTQARLFNAFSQADSSTTRRFGGTGLGFAVSKQLATMMGGTIGVKRALGKGSHFWFTVQFPILKPNTTAPARANLMGVRVLIVDDNAINRAILTHQVEALGAECVSAADGVDGFQAIRAAHEAAAHFHVALIDVNMPRMNGIELMQAVRADNTVAGMRMAMLTSMSYSGDSAAMRVAVSDAYLTKPVRRSELNSVLARLTGAIGSASLARASGGAPAVVPQGIRVLVAEDNEVNQLITRAMLEALGCDVTIAGDGQAAIEEWSKRSFDLNLMGCQMPRLDGLEAARIIRTREASGSTRVPIVALTANAMQRDRDVCLDVGMDDYVSKPFKRGELVDALLRWTNYEAGGRSGDPSADHHAQSAA